MKKILSLFILLFLLYANFSAQIRIREITSNLRTNYSNTETRKIVTLNQDWTFAPKGSLEDGVSINVPSTYNSDDEMVFQKTLNLSQFDIANNNFRIHFLGISYSADIFLNNIIVYKKAGGNIPFTVELANDLISTEDENILKVVVKNQLDSQNSIPLFQRFLFPKNSGGIVRDVFLEIIPKENIQLDKYLTTITNDFKSAQIDFTFNSNTGLAEEASKYRVEVAIIDDREKIVSTKNWELKQDSKQTSISLNIFNPKIWSPKNPTHYIGEFRLFRNDSLVDLSKKQISITKLENRPEGIFLNNEKFEFKGVTYIHSNNEYGKLISFPELKKDLQIIKEMGINSVRFAKATPHPFALEICSELGILPFIEIPLNSAPELIAKDANFVKRSERFIDEFVKSYDNYSPILIVGVGSGYLSNSSIHAELIQRFCKVVHSNKNVLTYASFNGFPQTKIKSLNLYGIELFTDFDILENSLSDLSIEPSKVFLSEATYPNYKGSSNGYLNKFSLEAQAKFFEKTIDLSSSKKLSGFFLNSMFDYYGDFSSLYTKYSDNNLYRIGILDVNKNTNSTSYKLIRSKLNNGKKIKIPLGSTKDTSPILFIIIGLVLSVLTGVLINSKKKLREDATRAFLRPYNFFADIRDHRIISGFATIILMLILAGSHSLLIISLLYYFRTNII
ncbi:MAG: hypothetical protein PF445_09405, partial [Melioribacteraceae bacterium]|nr:hypothetical protein [Melioribacteraceae bacterium]